MAASQEGHSAVVQVLLDKGANVDLQTEVDLQEKVRQKSMVWSGARRCSREQGVCVWQAWHEGVVQMLADILTTLVTLPLPPPLAPCDTHMWHMLYCMPLLLLHCQCYYPGLCVHYHNPATHVLCACLVPADCQDGFDVGE